MDINNPIPQEWTSYVTQSSIGLEVVPAHLYDTLTYTDNSTRELVFFQSSNVAKDLSNMTQPGMLPNPQSFLIQNIRFFVRRDVASGAISNISDIALLANTGIATLTIGTKKYGPWPLWTLSAGNFLQGFTSALTASASYGQIGGPLYPLFPNLMISPLQNFDLTLSWPSGAVDLSGNAVIQMLFDGQLARAVQ